MGDHHEAAVGGAPALLQVAGEPRDALDVQVVGGLVEEEDVVVPGEQTGQGHATALAAGEAPHGLLQVEAVEETAQDVPDLGV